MVQVKRGTRFSINELSIQCLMAKLGHLFLKFCKYFLYFINLNYIDWLCDKLIERIQINSCYFYMNILFVIEL